MAEELPRLADVDTLTKGVRWRWGIVCIGSVLLTVGNALGLSEQSPWLIFSFAAIGVVANLSLIRLLSVRWYRTWLIYAFCLLDTSLIGLAIVYLGPGGLMAGFFLVLMPCARRPSRTLGIFALSAAAVVFVAAATAHGLLARPAAGAYGWSSRLIFELAVFFCVVTPILTAHTGLFKRIAGIQSLIDRMRTGSFDPSAAREAGDTLGQVERSLRELLVQISSTVEVVKRDAEEVAALGDSFAHSIETIIESNRRVEFKTEELSFGLLELKSSAETGESESKNAAQKAQHLHSRANDNTGRVHELEETAELGRDRVSRAIETVLAIEADIDRAAHIFEELNGLSRQIGTSAITIAKIARHTHVLALNAAIEAARAEEHGDEFAVVADQVRTLAGEGGRSARDVRDLVSEVNAGIAAASVAMTASEEKINEVNQIAGAARTALTDIRAASAATADFVAATTESAQAQADGARAFASMMSQLASESARWHTEIQTATSEVSEQTSLMSDLHHTSERLADIAERLKREASMLGVIQPTDSQIHEIED